MSIDTINISGYSNYDFNVIRLYPKLDGSGDYSEAVPAHLQGIEPKNRDIYIFDSNGNSQYQSVNKDQLNNIASGNPMFMTLIDRDILAPLNETEREFFFKLVAAARTMVFEGKTFDDNFELCAAAFEKVRLALNPNSENHNKRDKDLDTAFVVFAQWEAASQMKQQVVNISGGGGSGIDDDLYRDFEESGKAQGKIFADSFLKNYNSRGNAGAFKLAIDELMKMPVTNSAKTISYNDFLIMNANFKQHVSVSMLIPRMTYNENLSDFMNNFIKARYEQFQDYYNSLEEKWKNYEMHQFDVKA